MLLLSETKEFFLGCLFCWCVLQLSAVFDSPLLALQSSAVLLHDHHHADQFSLWLHCHKSETSAWFVSSGQTRFFLECLTVESIPSSSAVSLSHFTAAYFVSTKLTLFVQSRCNTFIQLLTAMYDSDERWSHCCLWYISTALFSALATAFYCRSDNSCVLLWPSTLSSKTFWLAQSRTRFSSTCTSTNASWCSHAILLHLHFD